jgi:hypothetical protein
LFSNIEVFTTYKVHVVTSDEFGSGTNANVYIIIFGEHNNTGYINCLKKNYTKRLFNNRKNAIIQIANT